VRRAWIVGLALLLVLVLPEVAHACPVCFDSRDENRQAFFNTAVMLTLLPLGMVGGVGLWMRKRYREMDGSEDGDFDQDVSRPDS
jgi:hypothetical protein